MTYNGTAKAYPTIKIRRSGGTSATVGTLANQITGAALYLSYALQDGEELTIVTQPGEQSITSSFAGNVYADLGPSSDLGQFYLQPGVTASLDNTITAWVDAAGSPTITYYMYWRDTYLSQDD